jgi:hypothetical protein
MEAPDSELATLRAEVLRLKELMAVKEQLLDEVVASRAEMLASKNAQLSSKDSDCLEG